MKTKMMIVAIICQLTITAVNAALNPALLHQIDSLCGDVWCEGDFQFNFQSADVSNRGTEIIFTMRDDSLKNLRASVGRFGKGKGWKVEIAGSAGFYSVRFSDARQHRELNDDLYDNLNAAIDFAEKEIRDAAIAK